MSVSASNSGWYAGPEAVRGYYAAQARRTAAESELMKSLFPDKLGDLEKEKLYGVGHLDNRPLSAPADRGQTSSGT